MSVISREEYNKIKSKYQEWKSKEYRKTHWDVLDLPKKVKKIIESTGTTHSSIIRNKMVNSSILLNIDTLNTLTTVITIYDENSKKNIICGMVYSRYFPEEIYKKVDNFDPNNIPKHLVFSDEILTSYWNIGPSMESVDGEYRNQFATFYGIYKVREYFYSFYEELTKYLKDKISERRLTFHRDTFYPTHALKTHDVKVETHFRNNLIELNLYMMVWYTGVYRKITNIREDHVNERYRDFVDKYMDEDIEFFNKLVKKHGKENLELIYRYFYNMCIPGKENTTILGFGQKMIPLNLLEVQKPFDVRFVPWRDYLISQSLSKLVVNNICPGFPITNSWIYIKGSRKGLFNNKIQYQRIERSDQAKSIIELLIRSKTYTYQNIKESDEKETRGQITSWLSDKFKTLHDQIDEAVNFGKNEIIMSNVSFMVISEYTGRTWNDMVRLAKNSPYYNEAMGKPFTSQGYKFFKKYVFDLCYDLYCMNEFYGIIHGDLHLNNLTLYQKFTPKYKDFDKVKNPHVLYVVGDYTFILPATAFHTTIIDFGRCFIHPDKIELLKDNSIPDRYPITGNKAKFEKEQIRRMIRTYIRLVPEAKDQEPELLVLFTKNFNSVYKLMSVLDLYGVISKLHGLFELKQSEIVSPHKNCVFLMKKIMDICRIYLISDISKLMADKTYSEVIETNRPPLLDIMLKVFSDQLSSDNSGKDIIDVFIYKNPQEYSMDYMRNVPEYHIVKKYKENSNDGKLKEFTSDGFQQTLSMRERYEKDRIDNFAIVDLIARRHKEKIF